jgi:hypothetical protein
VFFTFDFIITSSELRWEKMPLYSAVVQSYIDAVTGSEGQKYGITLECE